MARDLGVSPSLVRTWIAYLNWEVRRSAEGHRIFNEDDIAQLRRLRAWLDAGNSLKAFRKERQGEGDYDPRSELRNGLRRLREMQSQEDALIQKHRSVLQDYLASREALQAQLEALRASLPEEAPVPDGPEAASSAEAVVPEAGQASTSSAPPITPAPPLGGPDPSAIVQGVLKQLLSALLARQGRLQYLGRRETQGRLWLDYMGPGGRMQSVEDLCRSEADRQLLETVLQRIGGAAPAPAATSEAPESQFEAKIQASLG